jgi:hypothetical protein
MKPRLGPLEQAILRACLAHQCPEPKNKPDLYRDELPALLWGWKGRRLHDGYSVARDAKRQPQTYPNPSSGRRRPRAMMPKFSTDKIWIWAMLLKNFRINSPNGR